MISENALEETSMRRANLESSLREVLFQIIMFANEKKDHIPSITNSEVVSFPYEITIPRYGSLLCFISKTNRCQDPRVTCTTCPQPSTVILAPNHSVLTIGSLTLAFHRNLSFQFIYSLKLDRNILWNHQLTAIMWLRISNIMITWAFHPKFDEIGKLQVIRKGRDPICDALKDWGTKLELSEIYLVLTSQFSWS